MRDFQENMQTQRLLRTNVTKSSMILIELVSPSMDRIGMCHKIFIEMGLPLARPTRSPTGRLHSCCEGLACVGLVSWCDEQHL